MSYEFYIMLTIAVVGAGVWIFKKAKRTVAMARKIRRAYRSVYLNPHSTLDAEQCKMLAVGALYAAQQGAYQNSLETGIRDELSEILGNWWGIENHDDAVEELDYLAGKGFRYYFPFVWEAFLLDDPQHQDRVFQQNMTSQKAYDKVTSQLHNLQETYDELITCGVIASKADIQRYGVVGWDAGRVCFLARACFEMGYLTENEAWHYIEEAYRLAREHFSSWNDLAMSYILGRSMWGGKRSYNSVMKGKADTLLTDTKSPWIQYPL